MGGIMGSKPKAPPEPTPPPVPKPEVMPDPDDPMKKTAARKRLARRIRSSGKDSTYLSGGDSNGLGGV